MNAHAEAPLTGRTVAITAHRRADEQAGAFERQGARVVHAPALKLVPTDQDDAVLAATREILATRPDTVVITTGYGLKRWLTVAETAGLHEDLVQLLRDSAVYARGAKAKGQLQSQEISCEYVGQSGRTSDLVDTLISRSARGTVAVQVHGITDAEQLARLSEAGFRVLTVAPYEWASADEGSRLADLTRSIAAGEVDYVTFTAAPAVDALFDAARTAGTYESLLGALRGGRCTAVAIGPVCVQPLEEADVLAVVPERFRLGAMVRAVCDHARAD
ncbi:MULTISPECIES: uroporphyrinogen-III synthase [Kocuria]|jgi:uroporphyrinogen-III synthase|uniref:Tetrapyrrole biosynthesis uroporphyrinogen III synthase domain-containing protein n=1 Tax=Kocuria gwangalliensis TaxID=501592 RepID=A0ABP8WX45_9MICC|nr:uroporphyrinogen-III synthase [Kocuria sp.]MDO5367347.1 uroporphyrinogen-III synthase [Kocuria sp.]